jgi:hypothetical protein
MSMRSGKNSQISRNTPTTHDSTYYFKDIYMDLVVGLPKLGNKSFIVVVVDHLSKYSHFCALQCPFTTSIVAQHFMDNIFKIHDMSHSIFFDHDPTFTNNFWKKMFRLQGIQSHLTTSYHPQTHGKTKVVNMILETYL